MTKAGMLSKQNPRGRGDQNAPAPTRNTGKGEPGVRPKSRILVAFAIAAIFAAAARLIYFVPAVQEWRLERAPLAALLRERGSGSDNPRLLYHVGQKLNKQGRFAEAEPDLRRAVTLTPDDTRVRDEWTRSQLGLGQTTQAFTQLKQFVGSHPDSGDAHLMLGKFYLTQNALVRAHDELQQAVSLTPDRAEGWAYLSQTASQLSQPGTVAPGQNAPLPKARQPLQAARKAVELAPSNARYRLVLAYLLQSDGQLSQAGQEYAYAVELDPESAPARLQYALWLLKNASGDQDRAQAEAQARQAVRLDPRGGASSLLLGQLLMTRSQAKEAVPLLTTAAQALDDATPAKELARAYRTLGNRVEAAAWQAAYLKRQNFAARRDQLSQQLFRQPNSRKLHGELARLLGEHGDVEGCLRNHAAALRRAPDAPQSLIAASRDLLRGGHVAPALSLAERAVTASSHNPDAREVAGDALLQSGRLDEAIASYNWVTDYLPDRAPRIQARVNQWAKAHPVAPTPHEKAFREAESLVRGQIGLQWVPARALELAEEAVRLDPGNLEYLRLAFKLQFGGKKTDAAIATAREILRGRPDDAQTRALLGVLLADRANGQPEIVEARSHLDLVKNLPEVAAQYQYGMGLLSLRERDGKKAVAYLSKAVRLDPDADIALFKLAQAQQMNGQAEDAAQSRTRYQVRQSLKQREFGLQGNIGQRPDQVTHYQKLAAFYEQQGRAAEARALRGVIQQRFGKGARAVR